MSISDIKKRLPLCVPVYFLTALSCGVFSAIYEHFSHGVYSNYMIYLFAFPLVGMSAPLLISLIRQDLWNKSRRAQDLYHSGIATLTVGSCLQGVLEIYGTTSPYVPVYWVSGALLLAAAAVMMFMSKAENK